MNFGALAECLSCCCSVWSHTTSVKSWWEEFFPSFVLLVAAVRSFSPSSVLLVAAASSSCPSHVAEVHTSHGGWTSPCRNTATDPAILAQKHLSLAPRTMPRHTTLCHGHSYPPPLSSLTAFPPLSKFSLKIPFAPFTPVPAQGRVGMCRRRSSRLPQLEHGQARGPKPALPGRTASARSRKK